MNHTPESNEELSEFPVLKYTVQLYYRPAEKTGSPVDNPVPMQIASGVLIEKNSNFFLVTCKHVFDNISPEDIVILTTGGFAVRLPKEVTFINNENESIDVTLIRLSVERVIELKTRHFFLSGEYLGVEHRFDPDHYYMLFGFINKKTLQAGRVFYTDSFGYLTNFRRYRRIGKLGFNYDHNITFEYSIRKQTDLAETQEGRMMGPRELKGLSGGGIWLSVAGNNPGTFNYQLVGIMIEERTDRGFIIGTKIDLIEKYL